MSVVTLLSGLLASGAAAQSADSKQVTVKKGALTITMPAVVNVRAKACVAVPYEYKVEPASAGTNISIFVRNKSGEAIAGEYIDIPDLISDAAATASLEELQSVLRKPALGKGSLRFCGQPQRATAKYAGPWAAAPNGMQKASAELLSYSGAQQNRLQLDVPFQLNVVKRK